MIIVDNKRRCYAYALPGADLTPILPRLICVDTLPDGTLAHGRRAPLAYPAGVARVGGRNGRQGGG